MSRWSKKENTTEVSFEIIEHLGALGKRTDNGWQVEVNVVSWNGGVPKVDIRPWNEDHTRCSKVVGRFNDADAEQLGKILTEAFK